MIANYGMSRSPFPKPKLLVLEVGNEHGFSGLSAPSVGCQDARPRAQESTLRSHGAACTSHEALPTFTYQVLFPAGSNCQIRVITPLQPYKRDLVQVEQLKASATARSRRLKRPVMAWLPAWAQPSHDLDGWPWLGQQQSKYLTIEYLYRG